MNCTSSYQIPLVGTSCSPSYCISYYSINTMSWIRKLDSRSYQGHWSAWRCCLLKKSSTRGVNPLLWVGKSSHPLFCFQSSLMRLWDRTQDTSGRDFVCENSHGNGECRSVIFQRTTWKGCIELCGRCIWGVWETRNHLLPWNSISICLWQVPQIVGQEFPQLHVQTFPSPATNRKVNLSNRWDFQTSWICYSCSSHPPKGQS